MIFKKIKQIKLIFIVMLFACVLVLCSCHKEVEPPQETYSITYVINGHGEQPENLEDQTKLPDKLPVLIKEGWTFEGWYLDNETFLEKAIEGTELTKDITLYAKWAEVIKKYSVNYIINGHGKQPENLKNQFNLPTPLPELSEKGWIFEGWYLDNETFLEKAIEGTELTKDVILYAKWSKHRNQWTVEYKLKDPNSGILVGETKQYVYSGENTKPVTVVPNIGYQFKGWMKYNTWEIENPDEFTRVDTYVIENLIIIAIIVPYTCEMEFKAKEGGKVEGTLRQSVPYRGKGEPVVAIPDEGFRFVKWSDGETEALRTNECVTYQGGILQIYAEFERYERDFKLEYNEATSNMNIENYTFYLDDMGKEQYLPVPQREGYEFMGWYSDWFHSIKVSDKDGKMIVDREWFNTDYIFYDRTNPDMKLFAKWKPLIEVPTYKILLIYVTEIHAALETSYYGTIQVDYVMTDYEKHRFEVIALRIEEYLEAILNGTIDFQVDTYYTKEPLNENSFFKGNTTGLGGGGKLFDDFGIATQLGKIPEVNDMLDDYGSVLTAFHLNDYENKLHVTGGSAGKKYGNIHLEAVGNDTKYDLDLYYPGTYQGWIERIGFFIHELSHTIEEQLQNKDYYGIHEAIEYYGKFHGAIQTEFDVLVDYWRNEFKVGDRNVGIPYEFWTGEYEKK